MSGKKILSGTCVSLAPETTVDANLIVARERKRERPPDDAKRRCRSDISIKDR